MATFVHVEKVRSVDFPWSAFIYTSDHPLPYPECLRTYDADLGCAVAMTRSGAIRRIIRRHKRRSRFGYGESVEVK